MKQMGLLMAFPYRLCFCWPSTVPSQSLFQAQPEVPSSSSGGFLPNHICCPSLVLCRLTFGDTNLTHSTPCYKSTATLWGDYWCGLFRSTVYFCIVLFVDQEGSNFFPTTKILEVDLNLLRNLDKRRV